MTGHPWHPAIVHFPLACWVLATTVDFVTQFFSIPSIPGLGWASFAHILLWSGIILAVPAMVAGIVDFIRLPVAVQDCSEMLWHITLMATAWALFLGAAVWRVKSAPFDSEASWAITLIELAASACLITGGYFAGVVVFDRLPAARGAPRAGEGR